MYEMYHFQTGVQHFQKKKKKKVTDEINFLPNLILLMHKDLCTVLSSDTDTLSA